MKHVSMKGSIMLLLTMLFCSMHLQAQETITADSTDFNDIGFRPTQLIAPGVLIGVGAIGLTDWWMDNVNVPAEEHLRSKHTTKADDYLQFVPLVANVGLGLLGVKSRHPLRERAVATATAWLFAEGMTRGAKWIIKERRPNSEAENSFPSGHAARAFMGAELIREEYGNAWGAGAYVFATGIAYLRLHNDRHWLNDVVAGAGIGILSARIGYWLLPVERKWFGWDKRKATMTLVPTYNPMTNSGMLAFSATF